MRPTMRSSRIIFLCATLVLLASLFSQQKTASQQRAATQPTATAKLSDFAWLTGAWLLDRGASRTEEHWSTPASNGMLGTSRTLRGDRMVEFEFLRIVARDGAIYYLAQPGGRPATEFKLTSFDGVTAIFENPQHDFPKRILYKKNPDGSLTARIDAGPGITHGAMEFPFKRM